MSASEWIWTKVGYGLIAILAGCLWGLLFYPFISSIDSNVSIKMVLKVFIGSFFIVGLINGKLIGKAGLGAVFALLGAIYTFVIIDSCVTEPFKISLGKFGKELAVCFILGVFSAVIVLIN